MKSHQVLHLATQNPTMRHNLIDDEQPTKSEKGDIEYDEEYESEIDN